MRRTSTSFLIFQRYYTWGSDDWEKLWDDLLLLLEPAEHERRHFLGSVVCVPQAHLPGVTPAYQVIDGQQRLVTLSVLLCALRDKAREQKWNELASEVEENYLIHKFKRDRERYKIYPRLRDRSNYLALVEGKPNSRGTQLDSAYAYYARRLEKEGLGNAESALRTVFTALATRLDFVMITLDAENPYKIFKSLNSTGVPLEEGDLIRNHVFTAVPIRDQDTFDDQQWQPLERHFVENQKLDSRLFAAFFRDVLMREGTYVGESAIYEAFEKRHPVSSNNASELAVDLERFARLYDQIRGRTGHADQNVREALQSIRDLNASTSYPLVLRLLERYEHQSISTGDLVTALRAISGFVLRRYVCGKGSRQYGRWFCAICRELRDNALANLRGFLVEKGWPKDPEFIANFQRMNLYESKYSWAVLHGLELALQNPNEPVMLDNCSIEHVMPQTIEGDDSDGRAWMDALGEEWQRVHGAWLHTPGNLTLVGYDYNIAMKKKPFEDKKPVLSGSAVYLNRYFSDPGLQTWNEEAMIRRARMLAESACKIWMGPEA
jgi:uncharacterized protein with ParB-like and HNH nuclease domain